MADRKGPRELGGRRLEAEAQPEWEKRVSGPLPSRDARVPGARIKVIVKVAREGYVPAGVRAHASVTTTMLTGETTYAELPALALDPLVVSLSLGEPIGPVAR